MSLTRPFSRTHFPIGPGSMNIYPALNPASAGTGAGCLAACEPLAFFLSLCAVAACGPPKQSSEGLPLVSVQHLPDGTELVMTGKILPKMDYSSTFTIRAEDGQSCLGEFSPKGVGTMTCSDGLAMNLVVPKDQYGRTTGAFVHQDGGIGVAVGWGDKADVVTLRGMF